MRAIYDPTFNINSSELVVKNSALHHLREVVRVKVGENILLLNGRGVRAIARIEHIGKKEILLQLDKVIQTIDNRSFDVAYCLTKKDSFSLALKMAVELNIKNFFPLISDFSQNYPLKSSRYESIIASAIEQSNASYAIKLHSAISLKEFFLKASSQYKVMHLFDLHSFESKQSMSHPNKPNLVIIGPEGGFSSAEREFFSSFSNLNCYNLNTNILRAPTALSTAVGFLLAKD